MHVSLLVSGQQCSRASFGTGDRLHHCGLSGYPDVAAVGKRSPALQALIACLFKYSWVNVRGNSGGSVCVIVVFSLGWYGGCAKLPLHPIVFRPKLARLALGLDVDWDQPKVF